MAPLRASTTKSEQLPDDPTGFVPSRLWKLPSITTWDDSRNQNHPTDSAEEAINPTAGSHRRTQPISAIPGSHYIGIRQGQPDQTVRFGNHCVTRTSQYRGQMDAPGSDPDCRKDIFLYPGQKT